MVCPVHFFQSQFISTIAVTDENDERIVFRGHYKHGDGGCVPVALVAMAVVATAFSAFLDLMLWVGAPVGLASLIAAVWLLYYEKIIVFDLPRRNVVVKTETITGVREETYRARELHLRVEEIAIRLAQRCGAVDLVLPSCRIRLIVDGKYENALKRAQTLHTKSGVPLNAA